MCIDILAVYCDEQITFLYLPAIDHYAFHFHAQLAFVSVIDAFTGFGNVFQGKVLHFPCPPYFVKIRPGLCPRGKDLTVSSLGSVFSWILQ